MGIAVFQKVSKLLSLFRSLTCFYDHPWRQLRTRPWLFLGRLALAGLFVIFALGGLFSGVVLVQARINKEDFANQAAVTLRHVIGRDNVNRLEYTVFSMGKRWRRLFPHPAGKPDPRVQQWLAMAHRPDRLTAADGSDAPATLAPLVASPALKGEGIWENLRKDCPGIWMTYIRPQLDFPDRFVYIVAIDLRHYKFSFIPGSECTNSDVLSSIPKADRPMLRAVFNGGFRNDYENHTGQRKDGVEYLRLRNNRGAVVIQDGAPRICNWTDELNAKYAKSDVRENLYPLMTGGQINEKLMQFFEKQHLDYPTFRDALGMTADGRWLLLAIGRWYEPIDVAVALQLASCSEAVYLDQNGGNVFFEHAFPRKGGEVSFIPLMKPLHLTQIDRVLTGSKRDFFYLTLRPESLPRKKNIPSQVTELKK